jgi:cyclopropane fatty-acyl-phospholipid synthase-like methyltransferase
VNQPHSYFNTRFVEDQRRAEVWRHLVRYLSRFVPDQADVLELGAGYCYFINQIAARRRVAVDVFPELPRYAAAGVETSVGDAHAFLRKSPPESFDFIFASNFFEHFEWAELNEMLPLVVRALRPKGTLGLVQPNFRTAPRRYFDDFTHRTVFTDVSLRDWLTANGLVVTHLEARFMPLTVKGSGGGLSFLVPLYLRLPVRPLAGQMLAIAERRE